MYRGQKLLALPVIVKGSSKLSKVSEEPSKLPNSLSQSQNKSIEPGGTPKSVSISFVPTSKLPCDSKERHFHFSVDELAHLVNEGPAQSTTSHKTKVPVAQPVTVIDDEACGVRNEPTRREPVDASLSRCSLLHCLSSCFGVRT